ncbi:intersectin 1 [Malassezia pachydermatis]|uniref:Actin cytoskeleton-regulatory complex protein PAN1 n=1 Tax=Malassezia pachydermatis TaxID=77020 RepID=A0A0M8MK37_9BASI|nr:intersectin 1 [Malassezia pachydermatis]KOS13158.1 intersectin 1 [Malassezia pachydermatis]
MYPMNQWGGAGTPGYGPYQQPQMTGQMPMSIQMPMQMQGTGMNGSMPNASFIARPAAPPPPPSMAPAMTGAMRPMMTQATGMPSMMGQQPTAMSPMMSQPTGLSPMMGQQPTGMPSMMGQPTGMPGMTSQPTGMPMAAQMTGVFSDPRMRLMYTQFLPASQPYSGVPMPSNMNFNQASMQPAQFQSKLQTLTSQQPGPKKTKIPWTMTKEERKSYDNIFRAWDAKRTGWISGDVARELFGQSGLSREQLLQIWHLADAENRGKLNIAEFHIAMALIYRALNGNDIPQELPQELIPSSTRDLSDSVDFLKDLLKQDTNVRNATALNLAEPGSNKDAKYHETRSFYRNPVERESDAPKQDAVAYKHQESESAGYRSRSRYLDRRDVRFDGQSAAEDLGEMKRQLEKTQRMLEGTDLNEEEDHDLQNEMEDVRYAIRRLQDDIEYYNRRDGAHAGEQRRKAERTLMQLLHERLPQLEKRLEQHHARTHKKDVEKRQQLDARNNDKYAHLRDSTPAPSPAPTATSAPDAASASTPSVSATPKSSTSGTSTPGAKLTGAEREAWIRSEAQRRVQERMRMLGVAGPVDAAPSVDTTVEQRLAMERSEAEARAAKADEEAKAREEARKARLREHKQAPPPPSRTRAPPPAVPARSTPESEAPKPVPQPHTDLTSTAGTAPEPTTEPEPPRPSELEATPEPSPVDVQEPDVAREQTPVDPPSSSKAGTNPFFRMSTAPPAAASPPASEPEPSGATRRAPQPTSLPPAQRSATASTPASRAIHLPPSHDEDWDDEDDESEDEHPLSSRATRQHLAQQLFSGVVPTSGPVTPEAHSPAVPQSPAPRAPPAPTTPAPTTSMPLGGGAGDRNALLSQIRGGQTLKKTTTRDRSAAMTAGQVLGSSSPPPGLSTSSVPEPESSDDEGPVAVEAQDVPGAFVDSTPVAVPEPAPQAEATDDTLGFDMTRTVHVRSLYPYEGGEGMLAFAENQVFLVHPTLNGDMMDGDWTYGALLSDPTRKGLIPAAYVAPMEQVVAAEALYDYEASSPEEASFTEGEVLQIVDQSDPDWWLVLRHDKCLMVPSNYVAVA